MYAPYVVCVVRFVLLLSSRYMQQNVFVIRVCCSC